MKSYDEIKKIVERCNKDIFNVIDIDTCVRKIQTYCISDTNIDAFLIKEAKTILKNEIEDDLHMIKYTNDMFYDCRLQTHLDQLKKLA